MSVLLLTGLVNVFALAGSFYLVTMYDCALPTHDISLLVGLSLGVAGIHVAHGLLDVLRSRVLSRSGHKFHEVLRDDVFAAMQILAHRIQCVCDPMLPIRDLDQVRAFLSGAGTAALLDLLWAPAFLVALYVLNSALGPFALGGAVLVASLALFAEAITAGARLEAAKRGSLCLEFCETVAREAKAVYGVRPDMDLQTRWRDLSDAYAWRLQIALDAAAMFAGAS